MSAQQQNGSTVQWPTLECKMETKVNGPSLPMLPWKAPMASIAARVPWKTPMASIDARVPWKAPVAYCWVCTLKRSHGFHCCNSPWKGSMASIFNNFPPGKNLQRMGRLKSGWTDAQTIPQEMIVSKLRTEWNPESQVNMTARERVRTAMGNSVLHSTCSIKEKILGSPI